MQRFILLATLILLTVPVASGQDSQAQPISRSTPAAVRSQAECTGFIADPALPSNVYVVSGADDDFRSVVRQFTEGDSIYISKRMEGEFVVGAEYNVIRPADELFRTKRYQGEREEIRRLGKPYEDVGQVRVTHVNDEGAVAVVTFSCTSILPGDTLVPFQPREIPSYTLSAPLDHFAPLGKGKTQGRIAASHNNFGFLGQGNIVYLNLGKNEGAQPGQRFRIYKLFPPHATEFLATVPTPPEVIGEAVVLSVQAKSCVAIVVSSYREISAGDYVEAE
jgi:hypothetical protein